MNKNQISLLSLVVNNWDRIQGLFANEFTWFKLPTTESHIFMALQHLMSPATMQVLMFLNRCDRHSFPSLPHNQNVTKVEGSAATVHR